MKRWCIDELSEFGRQHYKNVVYVRFDRDDFVRQSFEKDYDIPRLMDTLQVHSRVQEALLADYRNDFSKHATDAETHYITQIWDSVPEQLAREDKRFVHADVGPRVRAPLLRAPIRWLDDAALVQIVPRVKKPEMPLSAYKDGAYKMFFLDVGLLGAACKLPPSVILEGNSIFGQFKGALTEQYVQQQLRSECSISPYYWSAERAQAEVDFLIESDYRIFPVEVKAELNLQAKSLRSFCKRYRYPVALHISMSSHQVSTVHIAPGKADPQGHTYTVVDIPLYAVASAPAEAGELKVET
ncbi:MAG: DUF4143 domain-containing protein [Akkermansia sp.]|nr:DUF4143 domain-containing protein [Akkermansia sp.]